MVVVWLLLWLWVWVWLWRWPVAGGGGGVYVYVVCVFDHGLYCCFWAWVSLLVAFVSCLFLCGGVCENLVLLVRGVGVFKAVRVCR